MENNFSKVRKAINEQADSLAALEGQPKAGSEHIKKVILELKALREINPRAVNLIIESAFESNKLREQYPNEFNQLLNQFWVLLPRYQILYVHEMKKIEKADSSVNHIVQHQLTSTITAPLAKRFELDLLNFGKSLLSSNFTSDDLEKCQQHLQKSLIEFDMLSN
jgi:hypothetical protein